MAREEEPGPSHSVVSDFWLWYKENSRVYVFEVSFQWIWIFGGKLIALLDDIIMDALPLQPTFIYSHARLDSYIFEKEFVLY